MTPICNRSVFFFPICTYRLGKKFTDRCCYKSGSWFPICCVPDLWLQIGVFITNLPWLKLFFANWGFISLICNSVILLAFINKQIGDHFPDLLIWSFCWHSQSHKCGIKSMIILCVLIMHQLNGTMWPTMMIVLSRLSWSYPSSLPAVRAYVPFVYKIEWEFNFGVHENIPETWGTYRHHCSLFPCVSRRPTTPTL